AEPSAHTPEPVNFGNVRVGTATNQNLTLSNQAANDGFSEKLDASMGGATAGITTGGSFTLLAPQATDSTSLHVGIDTSTAGAKVGTATITLASDGLGTSGLGITPLPSQTVNVSGNVYRLANPQLNTTSIDLATRVGAASPTASISVTNSSPDAFTERLNASLGAAPAGFTGSGSIVGLAAGASSSALGVGLSTGTAGSFSGSIGVAFVSSGAGTTGAPDASVGSQSVALTGRVYTPAVATVNTPTVDFGIVHRGDTVTLRGVSVTNSAAIAAPNDVLNGSIGAAPAPFTASGGFAGLAAQQTSPDSMLIGLHTTDAGVFNGSATVSFSSHDAELADLDLGSSTIALKGQVNNFAQAAFAKASGSPVLTHNGNVWTLDFGSILQGAPDEAGGLDVLNAAAAPADALRGSFDVTGVGSEFLLAGFDPFNGLAAGDSVQGFLVTLDSANLGTFQDTIVLHSAGSNASGFDGALDDVELVLRGNVVQVGAVPEPGTWLLMMGGLLAAAGVRRRAAGRASMSGKALIAC
ncbi:MAG TPA: choice-of-anchor D domain-containing protein, partial [Burkholderiaceae bacterium]|nr:choice-of-anchor D domain-containing protein [Burkholderiaceae bacterium]